MSERFASPDTTDYALRPEYEESRSAALHEPALEAIEELMQHREHVVSRTAEAETARSRLAFFCINDEGTVVEVEATLEERARGPLRRMASLSLREYLFSSDTPFITEYYLEKYVGGSTQAQIETTDILNGQGLDARAMTFYDYTKLLQHVEASAEMVQILADAENAYESGGGAV